MTYEKFMEQVKEQILSFLPEEYANADVTIQEVSKNNNQKFHAICIKRPEDRIVPNVYLEDYKYSQNKWCNSHTLSKFVTGNRGSNTK